MAAPNLSGKLVRLAAIDLDSFSAAWEKWIEDSEYDQLLDTGPAGLYPAGDIRKYFEKEIGNDYVLFGIYSLSDERLIGFIDLGGFDRLVHSAWVAVGIGEAEYRGRGCGSEAMRLLCRYGFEVLNLHRINLTVFEFNPRAIRSYEKCGFVFEGRLRSFLLREGRRWDMIYMGLLREEWQARQG